MSVINQVLLELEKRHVSGAERAMLPDHVRALPDSGTDNRAWWIAAAAALILAGGGWLAYSWAAWSLRPSAAAMAPQFLPDVAIERVVAASAGVVMDVTPRDDATEDFAARPAMAGRLSLELASAPVAGPAERPEAGAQVAREPIPAARVLSRAAVQEPGSAAAAVPATGPASRPPPAPAQSRATLTADKPAATGGTGIEKQVRQPTARESSDNEYRKAAGSLHQGRPQEAQEGFRAALSLYPGHHGARQALVALLVESRMRTEAERVLQEGIKLAPEQIGFAMTLARLQLDRGDVPGAIATLQAGSGQAQGSPDYAAFLAALLQRQGRHDDAVAQFQAALRAKPNAGVWWLGLAISLQAVNRGPEAQDALRRAKATNNLNPELSAFADQRLRQLQ